MPAGGLLTAGVGLAVGAGEAIYAKHQQNKLNAQINSLQRPTWAQSPYENQMLTLAESQGGKGMSDASRTAYLNDAQSGLSGTISAIEKGGGDVNSLGNAYGKYEGGLGTIAMYDDKARLANNANVMNAYARQSANDDKSFMFNQYAPYADKKTALTQQLAGATNMFQSGLNTAAGGLGGMFSKMGQKTSPTDTTTGNAGSGGGQADYAGSMGAPPAPDYGALYSNFGSNSGSYYPSMGGSGGSGMQPGGMNTWGYAG